MQQLDERILEHLAEDGWSTPAMMAEDLDFRNLQASETLVRERCRRLTERELVEPFQTEMYEITTWGLAYLRGNLDAEMLHPKIGFPVFAQVTRLRVVPNSSGSAHAHSDLIDARSRISYSLVPKGSLTELLTDTPTDRSHRRRVPRSYSVYPDDNSRCGASAPTTGSLAHKNVDRGNRRVPTPLYRRIPTFTTRH